MTTMWLPSAIVVVLEPLLVASWFVQLSKINTKKIRKFKLKMWLVEIVQKLKLNFKKNQFVSEKINLPVSNICCSSAESADLTEETIFLTSPSRIFKSCSTLGLASGLGLTQGSTTGAD